MPLITEKFNYEFYEPLYPNPKYEDAVIVLGNSPGSPLQYEFPGTRGYEGPAGMLAYRVADAAGALVCAYERPGSTDRRPRRDIKAALQPGFAYDHTVGQTARALSAAILERNPETKQILLAGHSVGANYSLALAEHAHPVLFPVTNLSLVNLLRAEATLGTKLWHLVFDPQLRGLMPLRYILTDARYYLPTTAGVKERLLRMARERRDISMYVNFPAAGRHKGGSEQLAAELVAARPGPFGPKNRKCSTEFGLAGILYDPAAVADFIVRGFGGWSRRRRR
jgi:hypothetical protein